jgi:uncharacterized protein YeeX (DUF496 family)
MSKLEYSKDIDYVRKQIVKHNKQILQLDKSIKELNSKVLRLSKEVESLDNISRYFGLWKDISDEDIKKAKKEMKEFRQGYKTRV